MLVQAGRKLAFSRKRILDVSIIRLIVIALICATPAILLVDGPIADGIVAASMAVTIALVPRIRPGEATFFLSILRPIAIVAAIPAVWIFVQALPLAAIGLAHPIWESAATALGHSIAGSISIDTGASLMALARYLAMFAVFVSSLAVAIDRGRAVWILNGLTFATTIIALVAICDSKLGLSFMFDGAGSLVRIEAANCASLGLIFATASAVRVMERRRHERNSPDAPKPPMWPLLSSMVAFAICLLAIATTGTISEIVATAFGVATLMAVIVIRYLNFGSWGISAVVVTFLVALIAVVAGQPLIRTNDATLAFASRAPATLSSTTQRILADNPATGVGAGAFAGIASVYRDPDDPLAYSTGATAAATTVIEIGRLMFWAIVGAVLVAIFVLLRAALRRGRDSFYAACSAGCLLTMLMIAFCNAAIYGTAISIVIAAALGLAFGQSKRRAIPQPKLQSSLRR